MWKPQVCFEISGSEWSESDEHSSEIKKWKLIAILTCWYGFHTIFNPDFLNKGRAWNSTRRSILKCLRKSWNMYSLIFYLVATWSLVKQRDRFQNQNQEHWKFPNSVKKTILQFWNLQWFNFDNLNRNEGLQFVVCKHNRFYHLDCSGKGLSQRCCF